MRARTLRLHIVLIPLLVALLVVPSVVTAPVQAGPMRVTQVTVREYGTRLVVGIVTTGQILFNITEIETPLPPGTAEVTAAVSTPIPSPAGAMVPAVSAPAGTGLIKTAQQPIVPGAPAGPGLIRLLEFRGVSMADVLSALSKLCGFNLVTDSSVQ